MEKTDNLLLRNQSQLKRHLRQSRRFAIISAAWLLIFLLLPDCVFAVEAYSRLNDDRSAVSDSTAFQLVDTACRLIRQGQFDAAGVLIKRHEQTGDSRLGQLAEIVRRYKDITQSRQTARQKAYEEQFKKLQQLEDAAGAADANSTRDSNSAADVNDANDVTSVLSVITRACEFADEQQKQHMLSRPFVRQTIQKAVDRAAEYEAEGNWLDAYLSCYNWLQAIDPNNDGYADHAEELREKANIVASFQDSPCESRRERYEGVEKEIFFRAMEVLKFNYVTVPDYSKMALKALRRCRLLAEVIQASFSQVEQSVAERPAGRQNSDSFVKPTDQQVRAWAAALKQFRAEVRDSTTGITKDQFLNVFEKVLLLNTTTLKLPQTILIVHFAEAALSELDPYTVIVWPRQVRDFEKLMTNEFTGVGIEISREKGLLTVSSLLPGTPAYRSGLDAGDVIEAVDGTLTKDMSLTCAVKHITGPAGTDVTLTVRRPGEDNSREIVITRARITVPTIRGWKRTEKGQWLYMIDQNMSIGYLRITGFSEQTPDDMEKILGRLESLGLKGLIMDLRFNSGGLLNSATEITDKFLKDGLIVSTRPRFGVWTWASAHANGTHPDYPVVILINSGSASASEIVAGALADKVHNRAILVGSRTHGKGSVQTVTHYPGGGAQLKYTMAYYHLPSGQRVKSRPADHKQGPEDWGIAPHIEIKLRSDELRKMVDNQRDNDVLVRADHDNGQTPVQKHSVDETLQADPQLAIAALVIKSELIRKGSIKW